MYSVGIAYLLWALSGFGALGFHRFYLGKIPTGLLWMVTGGLCGIGSIYDLLTLPRQVREANLWHAVLRGQAAPPRTSGPAWRAVDDMDVRNVQDKEPLERAILRAARERGGVLSPSELSLEAKISLDAAKKEPDKLVSRGFAELRVRRSGSLAYTFPEFMKGDEDFEI